MKRSSILKKVYIVICFTLLIIVISYITLGYKSNVEQKNIVYNGQCGTKVFWKFDKNQILTIYGKGSMYNYGHYDDRQENEAPWDFIASEIKEIHIENGVETVGYYAFYNVASKKVVIADTVNTIKEGAFMGNQMEKIELPAKLKYVEKYIFSGCSNLKEVKIPSSVVSLGQYSFECCRSLYEMSLPDSVTEIGSGTFSGCSNLENIRLSKKMSHIGINVFEDCERLRNISIPEGVKTIPSGCFELCTGLETVEIPKTIRVIKSFAFLGCKNLKEITIPSDETIIEKEAFPKWTKIKR